MKSRQWVASALVGAAVLLFSPIGFASGGSGGGHGGSGGSGGGGGGGGTTTTSPVLPSTPPAPDVLMRESFGFANLLRPSGGTGTLKDYLPHTAISGFWVEYPGSKDTAWLAPSEGQTWRVCAESTNPYEMFSPLQVTYANGCVSSEWTDPITVHPTALMPFKAPAASYEVSVNGWVSPVAYLGFGFTDSSVLDSNLETSGTLWLLLKQTGPVNTSVTYELRTNGMTGPVLATGNTFFDAFSRISLSYNPATQMASASVNEVSLGTFPVALSPRFVGIEGVGIVDNFVVRPLP